MALVSIPVKKAQEARPVAKFGRQQFVQVYHNSPLVRGKGSDVEDDDEGWSSGAEDAGGASIESNYCVNIMEVCTTDCSVLRCIIERVCAVRCQGGMIARQFVLPDCPSAR